MALFVRNPTAGRVTKRQEQVPLREPRLPAGKRVGHRVRLSA